MWVIFFGGSSYTCTTSLYTTHQEDFIYVKDIFDSPDAGHSGREESADLARGVTIAAVHNIPPCSKDECGSEHLVK